MTGPRARVSEEKRLKRKPISGAWSGPVPFYFVKSASRRAEGGGGQSTTVRDGEPRAATSTFTQLLTSGRGSFSSFFRGASRPQKHNYGLLGTWEEWDRQ